METNRRRDELGQLFADTCTVSPPADEFIERLRQKILVEVDAIGIVESRPLEMPLLRRMVMNRRTAAAALIACVFAGLVAWPGGDDVEGQITFNEVCQRFDATRSISFQQTLHVKGLPAEVYHCILLANGVSRIEYANGDYLVYDPSQKRALRVNVKARQAAVLEGVSATSTFDYYKEFHKLRGDAAHSLGERDIDGRKLVGFRLPYETPISDRPPVEIAIWVDSGTRLPVRMESTGQDERGRKVKSVVGKIRFDQKLDEALFRLTPPPGFDVVEETALR